MALGISKEESWQRGVVNIPPGAALVLYTDGVVDAQNRQLDLFGKENMLRILRHHQGQSAQAIQDGLLAEISAFAGNSPRVDDITLMILVREP
jgi:sigma-B regulation protein RsbU (phosphoserine phosphatase)